MIRRKLVLAALVAACSMAPLFAMRATGGEAQETVVFAAASLREVFQTMALTFERQHPSAKVRFNFAGSQDLRVQIEQGAQAAQSGGFAAAPVFSGGPAACPPMVDRRPLGSPVAQDSILWEEHRGVPDDELRDEDDDRG